MVVLTHYLGPVRGHGVSGVSYRQGRRAAALQTRPSFAVPFLLSCVADLHSPKQLDLG